MPPGLHATARSSRLGVRSPRASYEPTGHGVHSSRCLAPPCDKHRESRAGSIAPIHDPMGSSPRPQKPVVLAPVESIRCGSATGTIPLAPAIRSPRRPREDQNHGSPAPGQHGARRVRQRDHPDSARFGLRPTTGFAHNACATAPRPDDSFRARSGAGRAAPWPEPVKLGETLRVRN